MAAAAAYLVVVVLSDEVKSISTLISTYISQVAKKYQYPPHDGSIGSTQWQSIGIGIVVLAPYQHMCIYYF